MPQGPLTAGTAANFNDGGDTAWTNPTNAQGAQNGTVASCTLAVAKISQRLRCSNFGFSIPTGATITGILVEIFDSSNGSVGDSSVQLLIAGSETGNDKATGSDLGGGSWKAYGSSSDLWGLTPTVAQINASGFGVSFKCSNNDVVTKTGNVDAVRITITYSLNGSASGSIPTLTLSSPAGSGRVDDTGVGDIGTLTLVAFSATVSISETGIGDIGTLTLLNVTGSAIFIPPPAGLVAGAAIAGEIVAQVVGRTVRIGGGHAQARTTGRLARIGLGKIPRRTP